MHIVKPLTDGEIERIHEASLEILETVGLKVAHEELLGVLGAAGAKVSQATGNVRLPAAMVREHMATLPSHYTIRHVDGQSDEVGHNARFFIGSTVLPRMIDPVTGECHRPTMADLRRNNALQQRLDRVKGIYRMAEPVADEPTSAVAWASFEEYLCNNAKHLFLFGTNREVMDHAFAVTQILDESGDPSVGPIATSSCPISTPLHVPELYGEYLLRSCRAGFAVFATTAPNIGATAPYASAASLALGNAENLFVAVVSQIIRPSAPFLYMYCQMVTDMRSGKGRFYSMDRSIARACLGQMARFYDVPCISDCGGSMPPRHDLQAGAEGMTAMLAACSAAPAWLGAVGVSYNGMAFSAEMVLVHAAYLAAVEFLERGVTVDDRHLALDSIRSAGPGGDFLTDELTLELLRDSDVFENDLFDMTGRPDALGMMERAREQVDSITAGFESPLPGHLQEALRRYCRDHREDN
jgi:trimethylamine--corrinoid protein Co-methyltransferase